MCHHVSSVPIFQTMGFTLTSTVEGLHAAVLPGHETDLQLGRRQGPRSVAAKCRARRCWWPGLWQWQWWLFTIIQLCLVGCMITAGPLLLEDISADGLSGESAAMMKLNRLISRCLKQQSCHCSGCDMLWSHLLDTQLPQVSPKVLPKVLQQNRVRTVMPHPFITWLTSVGSKMPWKTFFASWMNWMPWSPIQSSCCAVLLGSWRWWQAGCEWIAAELPKAMIKHDVVSWIYTGSRSNHIPVDRFR